jgi:photosystem II stability/assembly factor-like uncharacterized protein
MRKVFLVIPFLFLFVASCETKGDKFPRFEIKETLLGKINNHKILKASFINDQTGFVAISNDTIADTIMKTTDGCKSFTMVFAKKSLGVEDIQFVNENIGFFINRNNTVYKTLDGGISWDTINLGVPDASLLHIRCLNQDTLFIAAGGNPQLKGGYIIKSMDGGKTWIIKRTISLSHICFVNNTTGFSCGYEGIIKTTDCGITWDTVSKLSAEDILFIDENKGFFSLNRSLYKTVDGGRNWSLVKTIINPSWIMGDDFSRIEGLSFINGMDLIFTLNARLIKVTENQKWFQYEFTRPYYQLQMIRPNTGIVYGFENLILVDL